jgi:hypothetical protein
MAKNSTVEIRSGTHSNAEEGFPVQELPTIRKLFSAAAPGIASAGIIARSYLPATALAPFLSRGIPRSIFPTGSWIARIPPMRFRNALMSASRVRG